MGEKIFNECIRWEKDIWTLVYHQKNRWDDIFSQRTENGAQTKSRHTDVPILRKAPETEEKGFREDRHSTKKEKNIDAVPIKSKKWGCYIPYQ